ncbi:gamma-glutamyltranspeptidase [Bradyrhizobium sp. USDA 4524]|uniref:gamma-glutamyltransferase family protein n=1 Tax=unclassified Bradyrhizobium TaxID=2631580 RepID=UPI00209D55CF|nr:MULTISPECIES: gamma-glutamyltransferase family protein [unclassified Bradyrhizobium]MCP1841813.1 gamma-glutamyltranspeptidase/glutathione hydrolase [Bradyrhizobium sp. USDA 4538]MCP1902377.1 gamma-glutamyltranspeptidase/glutathione hydrolase [Bradyrhizobium sp. USDA 4537]MCP1991966.1 gamma-glutamyltranspeptidase/glutathione hydrolase [Bradyrhizobium sp. USDA 4539]
MLQTKRSYSGMVTAPHHLAAQAGLAVLSEGGNAVEAMIASAATIAVVYPHMNGLGGDSFWLVGRAGSAPVGIQACGRSAKAASRAWYREHGCSTIPSRGPLAALTAAGTVDGWQKAYELSRDRHGGRMPLARLLEPAIGYAADGVAVTQTLHDNTTKKRAELQDVPGFAEVYLPQGNPLAVGARLRQPRVAATLRQLAQAGLSDFYRGDLARSMAADLERLGSPLHLSDLEQHQAALVTPLSVDVAGHKVFNMPPPTQGLASLLILALYARRMAKEADGVDHLHRLVESTKASFRIRNRYVTDPDYMARSAAEFLTDESIAALEKTVAVDHAARWPDPPAQGDTVWLAATDRNGLSVSFIQSIYWEFGSGIILPQSGVTWQNRGTSFGLAEADINRLEPGRLPFHTIQPAMAELSDGRLLSYGTMGGEGQPQTQAAIFTRYALHGQDLQSTVTAPRWLLGRTWGEENNNLKIESRFDPAVIDALRALGHDIQMVGAFEEFMGHAGAIVWHPDGLLEGASDPRSDGVVAAR